MKFNVGDVVTTFEKDAQTEGTPCLIQIIYDPIYFLNNHRYGEATIKAWVARFGEQIFNSPIYGFKLMTPSKVMSIEEIKEKFPQYNEDQCVALWEQMPTESFMCTPEVALTKLEMNKEEFIQEYNDNNKTKS